MNNATILNSFGFLVREVYVPGRYHIVLHRVAQSRFLGPFFSLLLLCNPYEYTIRAYEAKQDGSEIDYDNPSIVCKETTSISADFTFSDVKADILRNWMKWG